MTNVQITGNIGRRESDTESSLVQGLSIGAVTRLEKPLGIPPIIMGSLDLNRVIARGKVTRDI